MSRSFDGLCSAGQIRPCQATPSLQALMYSDRIASFWPPSGALDPPCCPIQYRRRRPASSAVLFGSSLLVYGGLSEGGFQLSQSRTSQVAATKISVTHPPNRCKCPGRTISQTVGTHFGIQFTVISVGAWPGGVWGGGPFLIL